MAFDGHLDPPVSGTDGAILLTGGVSTKEEWIMAGQVLDPLITPPLPLLRACTALIMAKPPPSDPHALRSIAALSIWSNTMRRRVYIWSNRLNKSGVILPIYFISIYFFPVSAITLPCGVLYVGKLFIAKVLLHYGHGACLRVRVLRPARP